MWKTRLLALILLLSGLGIGYFTYSSEKQPAKFPFKLGLDLSGGTHLVYGADPSNIPESEVSDAMDALRDVIERRVNMFGVAEPIVQVEKTGIFSNKKEAGKYRLIVELPGVTDVKKAVEMIGATPTLEFKKQRPESELEPIRKAYEEAQKAIKDGKEPASNPLLAEDIYESTGLTGRFLDSARLEFDNTTNEPYVSLIFNKEGAELFAKITKENVGKVLAIYLDGAPVTEPVVRSEIIGGKAVISGGFSGKDGAKEAKILVGRLNSGALPIEKLELLSTQTIGASLGEKAISAGVRAGEWGLALVALFLILWYRLPGLLAVVALAIYVAVVLALFKLIPVTLTAAGIAGFVLSIGMAVDANVLIFERMKEELRAGRDIADAVREGFSRAWLSIRDGNTSSIITAVIIFYLTTALLKGFALTFVVGIIVSMFSAIVVTRTFLLSIASSKNTGIVKFLFGSGFIPSKKVEE
jgi:protein-export membrane protein SecD